MTTGALIAAVAALVLVLGASERAQAQEALIQTGFEEGTSGFEQRGPAELAREQGEAHDGRYALRITIRPGTELSWQQWYVDIDDVARGDQLEARVHVRSEGITEGGGAYMALEFVDATRQRVSVHHSKLDMSNGREGWEELSVNATAPRGSAGARASLVLNSVGTAWFDDFALMRLERIEPWPDLGDAARVVTVHRDNVVLERFMGVGFHAFFHTFPASQELRDTVIYKRWREMGPTFARLNDSWEWDHAKLDDVAVHILMMKEAGTEVYLTTWGPKDTAPGEERRTYARRVVDNLEYLVRDKGCTNIRFYCMTNELTLNEWGSLVSDMPKFADYHRELHAELEARGLNIALLASDASPESYWHTIQWAADNMDDVTGIYGGHHYINDYTLDDELFYPWFEDRLKWATGIARAKGKDFILGEFGCKQDGRTIDGIKRDTCIYWDTPDEPLVALQLADAALAAINAGVYGMGYWTFMDFPDDYNPHYINKWGTFRRTGDDYSTRDHYYGYGLLTKFLSGPATAYAVETNDPYIRAAAVERPGGGLTVAVVSRCAREAPLELRIPGLDGASFRKYVYDPGRAPQHPFGDLQAYEAIVGLAHGVLRDTVAPNSIAVYTTAYDDAPPTLVTGVRSEVLDDGRIRISWEPSTAQDLCYYRVYRGRQQGFAPLVDNQVGSTIATDLTIAPSAGEGEWFTVVAVDSSLNAGPAW